MSTWPALSIYQMARTNEAQHIFKKIEYRVQSLWAMPIYQMAISNGVNGVQNIEKQNSTKDFEMARTIRF
jgi:hypothetical protein